MPPGRHRAQRAACARAGVARRSEPAVGARRACGAARRASGQGAVGARGAGSTARQAGGHGGAVARRPAARHVGHDHAARGAVGASAAAADGCVGGPRSPRAVVANELPPPPPGAEPVHAQPPPPPLVQSAAAAAAVVVGVQRGGAAHGPPRAARHGGAAARALAAGATRPAANSGNVRHPRWAAIACTQSQSSSRPPHRRPSGCRLRRHS
jgi:hypothetical protein